LTLGLQGDLLHLDLQVLGGSGNPLQARVTARIVSGTSTFASTSAQTDSSGQLGLTGAGAPSPGCYQALVVSITAPGYQWNGEAPAASYCVKPKATVAAIALGPSPGGHLHAETRISVQGAHPLQARVVLDVLQGATTFASTAGSTNAQGGFGVTTGNVAAPGCYQAHVKSITAPGYTWTRSGPTATYCVPPAAKVALVTLRRSHGRLRLELWLVTSTGRPLAGRVTVAMRRGRSIFASGVGRTDPVGRFDLTAGRRPVHGCYATQVRSVSVHGHTWDGKAPVARLCIH
jgi:hypothetical protein